MPATRDPNMVVGAAYSHADMLKLDSLLVAADPGSPGIADHRPSNLSNPSARPKTPPFFFFAQEPPSRDLAALKTDLRSSFTSLQALYELSFEHQ